MMQRKSKAQQKLFEASFHRTTQAWVAFQPLLAALKQRGKDEDYIKQTWQNFAKYHQPITK